MDVIIIILAGPVQINIAHRATYHMHIIIGQAYYCNFTFEFAVFAGAKNCEID